MYLNKQEPPVFNLSESSSSTDPTNALEVTTMTTVKPAPTRDASEPAPTRDVKQSLVLTFLLGVLNILGFSPFKLDYKEIKVTFKLCSWTSAFSFLRICFFTLPFTALPLIFWLGGYIDKEWEALQNGTDGNAKMEFNPGSLTEEIIFGIEFSSAFLVLILPFVFSDSMAKPFECITTLLSTDRDIVKSTLGPTIPPLIGFCCFFIGKAFRMTDTFTPMPGHYEASKFFFYTYSEICFQFLSFLGLHFLLAVFEFFFYWYVSVFVDLANNILTTSYDTGTLLRRSKELNFLMENIQHGFGRFLLIDLTLMLLFWLVHTFNAYTSFDSNYLQALASVLIICAEFSRVFYLSTKCGKFTDKTNQVIMKLEEKRVEPQEEHEKKVTGQT